MEYFISEKHRNLLLLFRLLSLLTRCGCNPILYLHNIINLLSLIHSHLHSFYITLYFIYPLFLRSVTLYFNLYNNFYMK